MRWADFEADAPELAATGKGLLLHPGVVLVGTLRANGMPRISVVEPCFLDENLLLGMMWQSRKALDLLRDPRIVVRNAICSVSGDEPEFSLRGHALSIADLGLRGRFIQAVAEHSKWEEPRFHLFSVVVDSTAYVKYSLGEQYVKVWPSGLELKRPYE
jgi:hypothetical protein